MTEGEKPSIKKVEVGFDFAVAGVVYYRGEDSFSVPHLLVQNKTGVLRGVDLQDDPTFVITSDMPASTQRIDDRRFLDINAAGEIIGVAFENSRQGVIFEGLPLSGDLIEKAQDLLAAYHADYPPIS